MKLNKVILSFMVCVLAIGSAAIPVHAETTSYVITDEVFYAESSEKLTAPTNVQANINENSLILTWDDNEGAESYVIKYSTDKKIWTTVTSDSSSVTLSNLQEGTYYYKVAGKNDAGTGKYSAVDSIKLSDGKLPAPTNVKSTSTAATIKITWDSMDEATCYYVKYSTDRKDWTTKKTSSNTITLKSLKSGTKYYYQVAAVDGKKVGKYSKLTVRTTKEESNAKLNKTSLSLTVGDSEVLKVTGNTGKITWSSSDKSVATVSSKGIVKGVKAGSCKISAKVDGKTLTCKVTVKKASTSKVKYYDDNTYIPDFGEITDAILDSVYETEDFYSYRYYSYSFEVEDLEKYFDVLENEGFIAWYLDEKEEYTSLDFQSDSSWVSIMTWNEKLLTTILFPKLDNV